MNGSFRYFPAAQGTELDPLPGPPGAESQPPNGQSGHSGFWERVEPPDSPLESLPLDPLPVDPLELESPEPLPADPALGATVVVGYAGYCG